MRNKRKRRIVYLYCVLVTLANSFVSTSSITFILEPNNWKRASGDEYKLVRLQIRLKQQVISRKSIAVWLVEFEWVKRFAFIKVKVWVKLNEKWDRQKIESSVNVIFFLKLILASYRTFLPHCSVVLFVLHLLLISSISET